MNLIALSNLINYMAKEIQKREHCGSGSERHTATSSKKKKIIMLIHEERDEEQVVKC